MGWAGPGRIPNPALFAGLTAPYRAEREEAGIPSLEAVGKPAEACSLGWRRQPNARRTGKSWILVSRNLGLRSTATQATRLTALDIAISTDSG